MPIRLTYGSPEICSDVGPRTEKIWGKSVSWLKIDFCAQIFSELKFFRANTSAAEEKLGPLVYPRSSNKEYEVEIHYAKKLLADDNYKQHMKLAENLKKRGCLKEAKFMELRAMSYLLDGEEPVVSLIMEKEVKIAGQ